MIYPKLYALWALLYAVVFIGLPIKVWRTPSRPLLFRLFVALASLITVVASLTFAYHILRGEPIGITSAKTP